MIKRASIMAAVIALMSLTAGAFAYDFWGVTIGSASYEGSTHFTFDGLAGSGVQYVVGGWKYTRVDSEWQGPFPAPVPGEGFLASRKSDAVGLFYKPDPEAARFVIITTSAQSGSPAPELGYGSRLFGPGDLKIDAGGNTYGIGLRLDNLLWAANPSATQAHLQVYNAEGGIGSMFSRDAGTLGDVEINPHWARVGNQNLPAGSDAAYAFYVSGTGSYAGSSSVAYADTGVTFNGARAYAYEVSVPWTALGLNPNNAAFRASWRPDCGNDLITGDFSNSLAAPTVPEPCSTVTILGGIAALAAARKRS